MKRKKTKLLVSFAAATKLICVFVFAYADSDFLTSRLIFHHDSIWAASWENQHLANATSKMQISFAVTANLISTFVFATWIAQYIFFITTIFQASSHTAWLVSDLVRIHIVGFLTPGLIYIKGNIYALYKMSILYQWHFGSYHCVSS